MEIRDLADELQAILDGERPRLNKAEMREYLECLRASQKPTPNPDKTKVGVFNKFIVNRVDGADCKGGKHEDCDYFVLDVDHDPLAKAALAAYADAAQATLPILACDMRERYGLRAPTAETVRPWPKFVQDECLEVLRNMDTELSARGRKSARIERLINAIAGMPANG